MYAARWLLAPPYLGLSLALVLLGSKFFEEVIHVLPLILDMSEADLVLVILGLIDIAPSFLLVLIIYHLFLILRNSGSPESPGQKDKLCQFSAWRIAP